MYAFIELPSEEHRIRAKKELEGMEFMGRRIR
jgi:RNA recognition motif-containing protein